MITALVAGAFDCIHPGYIAMFKFAKKHCDRLIVAVHEDPSIENPEKPKPVLSISERMEILLALRYVDEVAPYTSEVGLLYLLETLRPDLRVLGDDYKHKPITGADLCLILWHQRSTDWTSTRLKQAYADSLKGIHENSHNRR